MNIEFCTVEVHFQSINDLQGDSFEVVPGSEFIVSRTAYRNSRNVYAVNGQTKTATEVTSLLKAHGIDLDHNRFLILQGEVESIAQMKPKGSNEHEEGLLEYLEDIIGTSDYITQIEAAGKAVEEAAEVYTEKQVRVKAAKKECDSLTGEKEKAENYLRQENILVELKSQKIQALLFQTRAGLELAKQRLEANMAKLDSESQQFEEEKSQLVELQRLIEEKEKEVKAGDVSVQQVTKELTKLEQDDVRMQENRKHLKNKIKGMNKSQNDIQKQKSELTREIENLDQELKGIDAQLGSLDQSLQHEEGSLEKICKSLQNVTGKYQAALDSKQKELTPFHEQMRKAQQELELAISSRDLIQSKAEKGNQRLTEIQERIKELEEEIKNSADDKDRLEDEGKANERQVAKVKTDMDGLDKSMVAAGKEVEDVYSTLTEAKETLTQSTTGNTVLLALMKEKRSGRIPGVHGRLGDLGAIDAKYDTAISTACGGMLNYIVVDTTSTGQKCIEHLRKHNLGRANFIILDKMRPAIMSGPSNGQRLFDLVKIKDTKLYADAFYFAIGETLVANNMSEATQLAYHSGPKRNRVVTLDGRIIETSGTMSGGGRPQRGSMKPSISASSSTKEEVTHQQVAQLEALLADRRQNLRRLQSQRLELDHELSQLMERKSRNQALLIKTEQLFHSLPVELADLESQLPALKQAAGELSISEKSKLSQLASSIKQAEDRISSIKEQMVPLEAEMAAIQAQIMEAGGLKFKTQKSKVDSLKEQIEHLSGRAKKLRSEKTRNESQLTSLDGKVTNNSTTLEAELKELEAKIEKHTHIAIELNEKLQSQLHVTRLILDIFLIVYMQELEVAKEELNDLQKDMAIVEKTHSKYKKIAYELKIKIEQDEEVIQNGDKSMAKYTAEMSTLSLHHIDLEDAAPVLTVYEDPADLRDLCKRLDTIESHIRTTEERLQNVHPNLRLLDEYRQKATALSVLEAELAELDSARQSAREKFESLRQRRYDEFMTGFRLISNRLKELYQLITLGGNAELELVDSLDPFSEGILFSVMPPKKSWKTIANLSGGEKTLSSLALVFALHAYKPTPIYVMDEIDAALDFRNVSIVAHYIKERTANAQFVVISLRNDMFELADRLVGIYKTDQRTKSATIDPNNFTLPSLA